MLVTWSRFRRLLELRILLPEFDQLEFLFGEFLSWPIPKFRLLHGWLRQDIDLIGRWSLFRFPRRRLLQDLASWILHNNVGQFVAVCMQIIVGSIELRSLFENAARNKRSGCALLDNRRWFGGEMYGFLGTHDLVTAAVRRFHRMGWESWVELFIAAGLGQIIAVVLHQGLNGTHCWFLENFTLERDEREAEEYMFLVHGVNTVTEFWYWFANVKCTLFNMIDY